MPYVGFLVNGKTESNQTVSFPVPLNKNEKPYN